MSHLQTESLGIDGVSAYPEGGGLTIFDTEDGKQCSDDMYLSPATLRELFAMAKRYGIELEGGQ